MTTSKPRFSITLSPETFDKLDNYRFLNRFQSRSQAAAALIKLGLEAFEKEQTAKKNGLNAPRY